MEGSAVRLSDPQWLYLLPLIPALAVLAWSGVNTAQRIMIGFMSAKTASRLAPGGLGSLRKTRIVILCAALALCVTALARPQYGVKPVTVTRTGIDVMILLDTSRSMAARDIRPSRLERARIELDRIVNALEGNRMGLVAFAGESFVECPLTTDTATLRLFLDSLDTSSIPVPGTAIGKAIKTAIEAFSASKAKTKAAILVTDGENLEGGLDEAVEEAVKAGIVIFPVGVGSEAGAPAPEVDDKGAITGYKTDAGGGTVITRLDSAALRGIAEATGGIYYSTEGESLDLDGLVKTLKGLEKTDIATQEFTEYEDRYYLFALAALVLLMADSAWALTFPPSRADDSAASTRSAV
jgi:Ca-activated chloride channel family protein